MVDEHGVIYSQLDKKNWCYICDGKVQCILAKQRNGIFSNLTVNFQGACDDEIQLNMSNTVNLIRVMNLLHDPTNCYRP